jgi:hypothetical protein
MRYRINRCRYTRVRLYYHIMCYYKEKNSRHSNNSHSNINLAWIFHILLIIQKMHGWFRTKMHTRRLYHSTKQHTKPRCFTNMILIYRRHTCKPTILYIICAMTNKCTVISQIITLLQVSTLSCHPQGGCNQYLAKLHKYFKCSCR